MARLAFILSALLISSAGCSAPIRTLRDATPAAKTGGADYLGSAYHHYLLALDSERVGDLEGALSHLQEAMIFDPDSHQILTRSARVLEQLGRREEAQQRINRALEIEPNYVPALLQLAYIKTYTADYEGAKDVYKHALDLSPDDQKLYLDLARLYHREGSYEEALEVLQTFSNRNPRSPIQHLSLTAILQNELGYKVAAEQTYLTLMSTYPWVEQARRELIGLFLENGGPDYAASRLEELFEAEPWQDWIPSALVDLYTTLEQIPELMEHLDTLEKRNPMNSELRYSAVQDLIDRQQFRNAETVLSPALERTGKERDEAHYLYAHIAFSQRDFATAAERYLEVAESSSYFEESLVLRAVCLELTGEMDQAVNEIEAYLAKNPTALDVQYALATIFQDAGRYEEAIHTFDKILEKDPNNISSIAQRAGAIQLSGNSALAISTLQAALLEHPKEAELLQVLAAVYGEERQYNQAVLTLEKALALQSDDFQLRFQLGTLLDQAGRKEEAISQMKLLLERSPNHPEVLNFIGYTYAEMGIRLPEAEIMIRKALESDPNNGYMLDSLGWIFYKQAEYEQAVTILEKAVALSDGEPIITEHLADAYLKSNRQAEALAVFDFALTTLSEDEDSNPNDLLRMQQKIDALNSEGHSPQNPPWLTR